MGNRKFLETYARFYNVVSRDEYNSLLEEHSVVRVNARDPKALTIPYKKIVKIEFFDKINEYENGKLVSSGPEMHKETWLIGNKETKRVFTWSFDFVSNEVTGEKLGIKITSKEQKVVSPDELHYSNPLRHMIAYIYPDKNGKHPVSYDEVTEICDIKDLKTLPRKDVFAVELYDTNLADYDEDDRLYEERRTYYIGEFLGLDQIKEKYGESSIQYQNCIENHAIGIFYSPVWCGLIYNEKQRKNIISPDQFEYNTADPQAE